MKHFLALLLLSASVLAQDNPLDKQFPENPEPVKASPNGGYEHDKLGDPPKQKTFTNKFVIAHSVFLASVVYDAELTHAGIAHHRCVEQNIDLPRHPSRGEIYTDSLIPFAAMTGFDTLVQWQHFPKKLGWIAYIGSSYGTAIHLQGGTSWLTGCW